MKTKETSILKSSDIINVGTYLPVFTGFYGTLFEYNDESQEIEDIDYERDRKGLIPLTDFNLYKFDYTTYNNDVAKACCIYIENELKRDEFISKIKFESVYSPREYNFTNDSINITVTLNQENIKNIIAFINEHLNEFKIYIKDNFTTYDGFMSYYSNDYTEWLNDINNCLKHQTQLGVILNFICWVNDIKEMDLYEACCNVSMDLTNYDDLTEKQYCHVCKEFVDPLDFDSNCCNDCLNTKIASLDVIICKCCKEQITNVHEVRSFTYQIKHNIINYSDVICMDCLNLN